MNNASITRISHSLAEGSNSWLRPLLALGAAIFVAMPTAFAEDHSVAAVQRVLKDREFYFGDIDGNLDFATQAAVRRFQIRNGLAGTAEIDDATLQALDLQAPPKAVAVTAMPVTRAVKAESNGLAQQAQLDEQRFIAATTSQTSSPRSQKRSTPPGAISAPSWHDAHRVDGERDEMRFAQRVAPVSNFQITPAAIRAITSPSTQDEIAAGPAETSVKAPAHFTGMDGHVYTYYKKVAASSALANNDVSPVPSSPQRMMMWARNARGEWQRVDAR